MARTQIDGADQIASNTIVRGDLNTATTGAAVIAKVIAGTNITISQTGVDAGTGDVTINATATFLRNRLINGSMQIDQRNAGASQTITAGTALAYTVDRWYAYCTGANVTGKQTAGSAPNQYNYVFTGAASNTGLGFGQRIEQANSFDLAGTTATLSVNLASSSLTTITWSAYYPNTADTFGSLASPTVTSIASGSFTITSTLTRYTANISIPSAGTTGLQIVLTAGALTAGNTLTIGSFQLEPGAVTSVFERLLVAWVLSNCQRYYALINVSAQAPAGGYMIVPWYGPVTMRKTPTMTGISAGGVNNAVIAAITATTSQPAGTFQINASAAGGYVTNALYGADAEL